MCLDPSVFMHIKPPMQPCNIIPWERTSTILLPISQPVILREKYICFSYRKRIIRCGMENSTEFDASKETREQIGILLIQFGAKKCPQFHILRDGIFAEVFRLIRAKYESMFILFKPPKKTDLCQQETKSNSFPVNVASDGTRLRVDEDIA